MRQNEQAIAVIKTNPLFRGFSAEEIALLFADAPEPLRFARGAAILGPGSTERVLGFLLEGTALVTHGLSPVAMSRLSPGACFGMATLFTDGAPFPNEIRAETACAALFLPREWAEALLSREARFASNYIALLSEKILFLNRRIDTFTADDVSARLRGMLKDSGCARERAARSRSPAPTRSWRRCSTSAAPRSIARLNSSSAKGFSPGKGAFSA